MFPCAPGGGFGHKVYKYEGLERLPMVRHTAHPEDQGVIVCTHVTSHNLLTLVLGNSVSSSGFCRYYLPVVCVDLKDFLGHRTEKGFRQTLTSHSNLNSSNMKIVSSGI